jgi:hypothetical protein
MSAPEEARTAQEAFQTLQAQFGGLADVADTAIAIGRRVIAERDALLAEVENAKLCARHTPERDHNGVLCRECANAEVVALRRERDRLRKALASIAHYHYDVMLDAERDLQGVKEIARAALADTADGPPRWQKITHGRHCTCSACAREDWTQRRLAPCGMHGSSCPREYQPWGAPGTYTDRQPAGTADGPAACQCDAPRCEREGCQDKPA